MFGIAPGGGDWAIRSVRFFGDTAESQTLIAAPSECCVIEFSPDGRRLLVVADAPNGRVTTATLNADGSDYALLPLPDGALNLGPGEWSPDGSRIAFEGWDEANASRNGIYTARSSDASKLVRVTRASGGAHDVPYAYSPDGSMILFTRTDTSGATENAHLHLLVVRTDGTGLTRLNPLGTWVDPLYGGSPATWSPDGKMIAFAAFDPSPTDDSRSAVFTIRADGSDLHRATDWGDWTTSAHYSPDGRWVVFDKVVDASGAHHLFLIHPDGSGLRDISGPGPGVCCAEWSPDSQVLVFQGGGSDEQHAFLWTMNIDGSGTTQLTATPGEYSSYRWGPSPN